MYGVHSYYTTEVVIEQVIADCGEECNERIKKYRQTVGYILGAGYIVLQSLCVSLSVPALVVRRAFMP